MLSVIVDLQTPSFDANFEKEIGTWSMFRPIGVSLPIYRQALNSYNSRCLEADSLTDAIRPQTYSASDQQLFTGNYIE
jgi:hypothetical protein